MNFGQEPYDSYQNPADFDAKVPFYMTYPMKNVFLEEAEYERDCLRLREMYPGDARQIQRLVSRECDKMEYEGSMMFDEYPDRFMIRLLCRKIFREFSEEASGEEPGAKADETLFQLTEVLLLQEMYCRRCRHHRCRRWF